MAEFNPGDSAVRLQGLDKQECCQPSLELLLPELQRIIFKMVGMSGLKALRLTSRTLRQRIEDEEIKMFKYWNLRRMTEVGPELLRRFSKEVKIIKDLQVHYYQDLNGSSDEFVQSMRSLIEDHHEVESLHLWFSDFEETSFINEMIRYTGHVIKTLEFSFGECTLPLNTFSQENLPCLQRLSFYECGLLDLQPILQGVGQNLVELQLVNSRISAEGLSHSCQPLEKLTLLDLQYCDNLTDHGLTELLTIAPNIQALELVDIDGIKEGVGTNCQILMNKFTRLEIINCENLTDDGLSNLFSVMPNLQSLSFAHSKITGEVRNRCKSLEKMTKLELRYCDSLIGCGLGKLLSIMPYLQTLQLYCLPPTAYEGVSRFCKCLPKLTSLIIKGRHYEGVSEHGLLEIVSISPNLKTVFIMGVTKLSEQYMKNLRNRGIKVMSLE